jgi:transposase InsO family protein
MGLGELVVAAVFLEGRPKAEVARSYGVSRRWVHVLCRRFEMHGHAGLRPASRRPHSSPHQTSSEVEDAIVSLRKLLSDQGLDAGAHTIAFRLAQAFDHVPSVATIWRIVQRRGFVTAQPQKRPKSSYIRFAAEQPNERWQADITHWTLEDGSDIEILNILDDHSRLLVGSTVASTFKAADVVAAFHLAFAAYGFPASVLTDNGAVFTAAYRGASRCTLELELARLGISHRHSRPYHPQTCGKVERFHQTLKKWLENNRRRRRSRSCKHSWTGSSSTTTRSDHTGHSAVAPRVLPSTRDQKRCPLWTARLSRRIAACDAIASTPAASSPCATTVGCTTSASVGPTATNACCSSSRISTSAS